MVNRCSEVDARRANFCGQLLCRNLRALLDPERLADDDGLCNATLAGNQEDHVQHGDPLKLIQSNETKALVQERIRGS